MTASTPVRIFCSLLLLASSSAFASSDPFSEKLSDWRQPVNNDSAPAAADTLALKSSEDIGQSIIRELVLLKGEAMLGTPYSYGSNEAKAVDCSALIQQLFQNAGIELPRTTRDLATIGEAVSSNELQPGDLLFYRWKKHGLHVAIYMGDGFVIHASPSERSVVITELNKTWDHHFVAARRVMVEADA